MRRLDPSIRSLLLDLGFIVGALVVALASYFAIRGATGDGAPQAVVAGVIATATPTAAPHVTATTAPAATAAPPTIAATTPTPTPAATATDEAKPTPAATAPPMAIDAALGRQQAFVCVAGSTSTEDASKRRAVRSWNQLTTIWNRVVESEGQLNAAIPSPFTLENAAASETFLAETRRHETVLLAAIDELVTLRAAGIHTQTREMSLRQGDSYDFERLLTRQTIEGVVNQDVAKWNGAAFLEPQRTSYLQEARAAMTAVCDYLREP